MTHLEECLGLDMSHDYEIVAATSFSIFTQPGIANPGCQEGGKINTSIREILLNEKKFFSPLLSGF